MTRTDRLYALVEELRAAAPRPRTVAALADRLTVSERTIQRDLQALMAAGVPVRNEAGPRGGWFVDPTMTLPPVTFTTAEALAVAAALAAAEHSAPFAGAARTAMQKVAAVVNTPASAAVRELAGQLVALPAAVDPAVRAAVEQAVLGRRVLHLTYRAPDGRESEREVEPAGLLTAAGRWYLVGWCRARQAPRGFRLDRIVAAVTTPEAAPPRALSEMIGPLGAGAAPPAALDGLA